MKIDPITLKMLLESMNEGAREMHLLLRGPVTPETIEALARVAHKLKGEATVVGLGNLSHLITGLEDSLERLQGQKKLHRAHLRVVVLQLKKIVKVCELVRKRSIHIRKRAPVTRVPTVSKASGVMATLHILAQNVGRSCGKRVSLNLQKFDISEVPPKMQIKIQDIVIQLIRNAITHGIELPEHRERIGKMVEGCVWVITKRSKNSFLVAVRDNGHGIDLEAIRKRLVLKYNYDVPKVAKMPKEVLVQSLFLPGFTTLTDRQQHAGRGVGLDLVRDHAKSLGGRVEVSYKENQFTQFIVQIPFASAANVTTLPVRSVNKPVVRKDEMAIKARRA